jgi:thiol-disulfide isomerase/thioredoxin
METNDLYKTSEYIIELKYKDFKKKDNNYFIYNNKNTKNIFLFYLPSCKHCNKIIETWNEISVRFNNDFKFYSINCDDIKNDNDLLCSSFKIKQYPSIKYTLKDNKYKIYKGTMDKDDLYYFMCLYI